MILIFSIDQDSSTSDVLDWLDYYGVDAIRTNGINYDNFTRSLTNTSSSITINGREYSSASISSTWIRKAEGISLVELPSNENKWLAFDVNAHLSTEFQESLYSIFNYFKEIRTLGIHGEVNKLDSLEAAAKCGLSIPETIITNSKNDLLEFSTQHTDIICKAISNATFFPIQNIFWGMYTVKLKHEFIKDLPDKFFPCLAQEYIDKEYEIRTFYIEGKCYSMALFSQSDPQTAVDFRKYNNDNPTRAVPYLLPENLEMKIRDFMNSVKLNTGSLDFIKSKDGKYIFLEVNPSGQFGMVSYPCNYFLEKKIASWLSKIKDTHE